MSNQGSFVLHSRIFKTCISINFPQLLQLNQKMFYNDSDPFRTSEKGAVKTFRS